MTLVKPGLKPVSGLFGRNRLPLFLGEFGAIRQSLVCIGAAAVHEMAPRRCAACNPSMLAAGMTCWMCFVARVSTMSARVAPPTSSRVPSSACIYGRRREDKGYNDDQRKRPDSRH
jgi:hypothetical protein